jgi:hypothetical protein
MSGIRGTFYPQKLTKFAKWRSFSRYISLADSDHGVCFLIYVFYVQFVTISMERIQIYVNVLYML